MHAGLQKIVHRVGKTLIQSLKKINPYIESNIFRSVENINLDTVIAYKEKGVKHSFLDNYNRD